MLQAMFQSYLPCSSKADEDEAVEAVELLHSL